MNMNQEEYLQTPCVVEFINYLANTVSNANGLGRRRYFDLDRKCNVELGSFEDAYKKYCWNGRNASETEKELGNLSALLRDAYDRENLHDFLKSCYDVLDWGGGGNLRVSNIDWMVGKKDDVINAIRMAIGEFTKPNPNLARFDGKELRSNAGLTKIYSLLEPNKIVIYDSRVAAGLGMLISGFFRQEKLDGLPEELSICWMPAKEGKKQQYTKNRDPSYHNCKFQRCAVDHSRHAKSNILANWILAKVLEYLRRENPNNQWTLRKLESALFMMGYDLNDQQKRAPECTCSRNGNTLTASDRGHVKTVAKKERKDGQSGVIRQTLYSQYFKDMPKNAEVTIASANVKKSILMDYDLTLISQVMRSIKFLNMFNLVIAKESGPKSMLGAITVVYRKRAD